MTPFDNTQAFAEGWSLFNDGEIQRIDEMEVFPSDAAAIAHVRSLAESSEYHRGALAIFDATPAGPALIADSVDAEASDYILSERHESAWISIGNISVHISRKDEGVSVSLYPKGDEMADSLAETWASFAEAEPEAEDPQLPESPATDGSIAI